MAENKKKSSGMRKGVLAVALMCGIGAVGGIAGTSAFFTDKGQINSTVNVGTMNMKVTDMSDLDGDYGTHGVDGSTTGAIKTAGYQGTDFTLPAATDAASPSTGIINPGDDGIYAYKIENTGEKSFDTAKVVTVTVTLKDADATLDALTDSGAYFIDGLNKGNVLPKANVKGNKIIMKYAANDDEVLSGSKEADGKGTSAVYAYNTEFARNVKNKFQGATVTINTEVYAKQHRNSVASELKLADDGTVSGTGDWTNIGSFETVVD